MFQERYSKNQPAVKAMAQKIAANGSQVFRSTDEFVASYGREAADMIAKGGLLAALWDIGYNAVPASFGGEGRNLPKGLRISPRHGVAH